MGSVHRRLHWPNVAFLTCSPIAALGGSIVYSHRFGVHPFELLLFLGMFGVTGLSITAGYHRHFAHVSYKAHPLLRIFYLVFGACALENSAINWASDHRLHHRYADTDKDPYNVGKGFWFSHIGWIFYESRESRQLRNVGDLLRDRWVRWQHRYHVPIAIVVGFGLPTLIGFMIGRPFGAFLWGGLIRVVFVHHMTFFINSLAHMKGTQPYSRTDTSRDSWWLAFLTNGEGYHNYHHRFPSDYRNGIRWYQWDPTKWFIYGFYHMKLADRLHRIPPQLILKTRMEVDALEAEKRLHGVPQELGDSLRIRLDAARLRLEQALAQWAETKAKYRELKNAAWHDSEQALQHWQEKLREYESHLQEARDQWRELIQGLQRIPA